jgi:uncharacterized hydrophobic protein (TIGR00271 family)
MIIATLIGPIMGIALAFVDGDVKLLRSAILAESLGVGIVCLIGYFVGRLHHDLPLTQEVLSRTKPNLLDLAIAVAGGAAGAYATVSPRVSVGIVGVAISTALVPPLAAAGICLSRGNWELAGGALILFATNLVAIQCAASVVLFIFGYHKLTTRIEGDRSHWFRLATDFVLFAVLFVFLFIQLSNAVERMVFEERVKASLERGLSSIPGAYLAEARFRNVRNVAIVVAVVRAPNSIPPKEAARLQAMLPKFGNLTTELHVRTLLTKETTSKGYLHEIEPTVTTIEDPSSVPATEIRDSGSEPQNQDPSSTVPLPPGPSGSQPSTPSQPGG